MNDEVSVEYYSATKVLTLTAKSLATFVAQNAPVSRLPTANNRNSRADISS